MVEFQERMFLEEQVMGAPPHITKLKIRGNIKKMKMV